MTGLLCFLERQCRRVISSEEMQMCRRGKENKHDKDADLDGDVSFSSFDLFNLEAFLLDAIKERQADRGGYPEGDLIVAMEEPIAKLVGAVSLLSAVAQGSATKADGYGCVGRDGLVHLAQDIERWVFVIFALYHGRLPCSD